MEHLFMPLPPCFQCRPLLIPAELLAHSYITHCDPSPLGRLSPEPSWLPAMSGAWSHRHSVDVSWVGPLLLRVVSS